jgi:hypothetical protein
MMFANGLTIDEKVRLSIRVIVTDAIDNNLYFVARDVQGHLLEDNFDIKELVMGYIRNGKHGSLNVAADIELMFNMDNLPYVPSWLDEWTLADEKEKEMALQAAKEREKEIVLLSNPIVQAAIRLSQNANNPGLSTAAESTPSCGASEPSPPSEFVPSNDGDPIIVAANGLFASDLVIATVTDTIESDQSQAVAMELESEKNYEPCVDTEPTESPNVLSMTTKPTNAVGDFGST